MTMLGKTQGPRQREAVHKANLRHGYACSRSQGRKRSEYKIWIAMRSRCANPHDTAYPDYGARGIRVCDRWISGENGMSGFQCFIADMGDRPDAGHSIHRKDNAGNYTPQNCEWVPRKIQARNKRTTIIVEWEGQSVSLRELCERMNIEFTMVIQRIQKLGWPLKDALAKSPQIQRRKDK